MLGSLAASQAQSAQNLFQRTPTTFTASFVGLFQSSIPVVVSVPMTAKAEMSTVEPTMSVGPAVLLSTSVCTPAAWSLVDSESLLDTKCLSLDTIDCSPNACRSPTPFVVALTHPAPPSLAPQHAENTATNLSHLWRKLLASKLLPDSEFVCSGTSTLAQRRDDFGI